MTNQANSATNVATEKNIGLKVASSKDAIEKFGVEQFVTRSNSYKVNAAILKANFDENPRKDYGSEEEFNELVESIRTHGVLMPLTVTSRGTELYVSHGFRRFKAIQVLMAEGIEMVVEVKQCQNAEEVLIQHLTLNSGKPLNDAEISETLLQLSKYIGADNYKEIARRVGLDYQKVVKLMNYAKNASSQVKQAVTNNEVTLTNAIEFVVETPNIVEQNEILEMAKQEPIVLKNSTKKVVLPTKKEAKKATDKAILKNAKNNTVAPTVVNVPTETLPTVPTATTTVEKNVTPTKTTDNYTYLWKVLEEAEPSAFNTQLQKLLFAIEKGEQIETLVKLID